MGVQILSWKGTVLRGKGASRCKVQGHCAVIYAKTTEPDRDAAWVMDSHGPKESCVGWGPHAANGNGQFWGKGRPL